MTSRYNFANTPTDTSRYMHFDSRQWAFTGPSTTVTPLAELQPPHAARPPDMSAPKRLERPSAFWDDDIFGAPTTPFRSGLGNPNFLNRTPRLPHYPLFQTAASTNLNPTSFEGFQRPAEQEPVLDFSDSPSFRRFPAEDLYHLDNMSVDSNNPYDLDDPLDDLLEFENQSHADSVDTGFSYDATSSTSNSIVHSLLTQSSRASSDLSRNPNGLDAGSARATEERRLEQRQKQIDYGKVPYLYGTPEDSHDD